MQAFSSALSELYNAAETRQPEDFSIEAFRILRQLLFFDGGLLGSALVLPRNQGGMPIVHAHSYGRRAELLHDYTSVVTDDPVARRISNGLTVPHSCSCMKMYKERHLLHLFAFAKKHELSEVLAFGDPADEGATFRWVMLYRRANHPFDTEDTMILKAWWPHLTRAGTLNLRCMLEREYDGKRDKAMGLLDAMGNIQARHDLFSAMLREEWPKEQGKRLPKLVWDTLKHRGIFKGRTLCLTASSHASYLVCEVQSLSTIDRLGALERSVALLVADGHDYKTIASRMGTSPNTVRNQISRIYKKLNVHDKLSLAMLFHRGDSSPSPASVLPSNLKLVRTGTSARAKHFSVNVSESTMV